MPLLDAFRKILRRDPPLYEEEEQVVVGKVLDPVFIGNLRFKRLSTTAIVPKYATPGAAGMDLYADHDAHIMCCDSKLILTNIAIELPNGLEAQVRSRSGLALKSRVTVLNSPGTIDPDYRGGIGVILYNNGDRSFIVKPGDRIAQLVVAPFVRVKMVEIDNLDGTVRGAGGFGSTGVYDPGPYRPLVEGSI